MLKVIKYVEIFQSGQFNKLDIIVDKNYVLKKHGKTNKYPICLNFGSEV